jgi:hypothetical protein
MSLKSRKTTSCVRMCRFEVCTPHITITQVIGVNKLSHLPALIYVKKKPPSMAHGCGSRLSLG